MLMTIPLLGAQLIQRRVPTFNNMPKRWRISVRVRFLQAPALAAKAMARVMRDDACGATMQFSAIRKDILS